MNFNLVILLCVLAIFWKADSRSLSGKRTIRAIECRRYPPYQEFWTSEGCRMCTNCTLLLLRTRLECKTFTDAVCEDICLNKNDVFDPVIKQCVPGQNHGVLASTEAATEKAVQPSTGHNTTTAAAEVLSEGSSYPLITVVIRAVFASIPVAVVTSIVCIIWRKKQKTRKQCGGITANSETEPMVDVPGIQTRTLQPTPPTERKKPEAARNLNPSTNVSHSICAEGVPDPQLSMDPTET